MKRWAQTAWMRIRRPALTLLSFIAVIWLAHLVNVALDDRLTELFALVPRRIDALEGVVAMPFLHGNFEHLQRNTVPLLALGALILWMAPRRFWLATALIVLISGLFIWFFAREARHIGASALVFGWMGFIVAYAFVERTREAFAASLIAVLVFGAEIILGLSPTQELVSWDGHLAGLVAGVLVAILLRGFGARRAARRGPNVIELRPPDRRH